ncbi:hypothetical protein B0H14DRAFT_3529202 [Mycena olivaceomarginata]|nr:hypothetical protein B0H14DRAFT_3529202 [Mycena olivaceomarginata]
MPFFPNAGNFVGSKEHDKNPRKFWFLVLTDGLYTKKTDADAVAGSSKIYIFFTRSEARDKWARNCLQRHAHSGDGEVPDSEGKDAVSSDDHNSSMRSVSLTTQRPASVRNTTPAPAHRAPGRIWPSSAPKGTPPPKRESPGVSAPLSVVFPRTQKTTPPPLEMEVDAAPIREDTPSTGPLETRPASSRNTGGATPPGVISSSVSSPSSLSATSSEAVSHPHPFRDLAASASAPRPAPTRLRLPNRAPTNRAPTNRAPTNRADKPVIGPCTGSW